MILPLNYYSNRTVMNEILNWCNCHINGIWVSRWIGIYCSGKNPHNGSLMIRYLKGKPLRITSISNFKKIQNILKNRGLRTFYATSNLYFKLDSKADLYNLNNIYGCMPTWDVDNIYTDWKKTIAVCREIVSFLESNGISKSIILKWSGNGIHVHIHHEALSRDLRRRYGPLNLAYSIVEYVIEKLHGKILEIKGENTSRLKVENVMDIQRLFTCPLSLHRQLDLVCICFTPNDIDSFNLDWTNPENFRHNFNWNSFVEGEADDLALKAINIIGGYPYKLRRSRKESPVDEMIRRWLEKY